MKLFFKKSLTRIVAVLICSLSLLSDSYIVNATHTILDSVEHDIKFSNTESIEDDFINGSGNVSDI